MKVRKPRIIGEDLVDQRFGMMTVIEKMDITRKGTHWRCRCDCGGEKILTTGRLKSPYAKNCGCVARNNRRFIINEKGERVRPPGFHSWTAMKSRCTSKCDEEYKKYGAKGITVCERWLGPDGFENFMDDMGPKPTEKHSIGRRLSNDNYSPETCRWETALEQGQNKSNARLFTHNGKTQTITAWCRELGLAIGGFHWRLRRGWPIERILSTPNIKNNRQPQIEAEAADCDKGRSLLSTFEWV